MTAIDITGLDMADILAALFNAAAPLGLPADNHTITREQAQRIIDERGDSYLHECGDYLFDYVDGRIIMTHLGGDTLDPHAYDNTNGQGAAERAINELRASLKDAV